LPVGEQQLQELDAIKNQLSADEPMAWPTVEETPLSEYQTPYLVTIAFPALFPDGKGDPTNQHDNMKLLCDAIHKAVTEFPPYLSEVLNNFVCSIEDEDCVSGNCDESPRWFENLKSDLPFDEPIQWFQWERIPKVAHNQNNNGKECKVEKQKSKTVSKRVH
jgi:hypothetical protein